MEQEKQFKCTGDCLKCIPIQRQYCTCQFTYNTMRLVEHMQGTLDELKVKIEAIQGNEAALFDPTEIVHDASPSCEDIAQEGSGVE